MTDYKTILGIVAVVISIFGYIPYFQDIILGKTKPHAFSWLVWGVLNAIAFAGQIHGKGGAGTWAVGLTAVALFAIFVLSLVKGEKHIKLFDWLCLGGAALALLLWGITKQPLASIILITVVDAFGFLPTVRKAYAKPHQETLVTYEINTIKYMLVVLALQNYTLLTTLFPLAVALMNALFVVMLIIRRKNHNLTDNLCYSEQMSSKAIFLDRDGTVDVGVPKYERVDSLDKVELLPKTIEALKRLAKLDYLVFFVTKPIKPALPKGL